MLLNAKGEPIRSGRIDLSPGALNYYPGDPRAEQRVRELRRSVLGDPVLTEHVVWRGELAVSSEKLQRMKHMGGQEEAARRVRDLIATGQTTPTRVWIYANTGAAIDTVVNFDPKAR